MKEIKFIHTADLHLDSPMRGLRNLPQRIFQEMQESTFESLQKIVDQAISYEVDFLIIAGDLFDSEDRSIRAQIRFKKAMEKLAAENIPVYIVHGNHDHLNSSWPLIAMPDNVHVFDTEVETKQFLKDNLIVNLQGFSYYDRHLYEEMITNYSKQDGADYHIGILHGHADGPSAHNKYAPFTLNQLLEKDFDYWALGHIHKREILHKNPPIIYPGNIQGRHRNELGEKGCYLVSMSQYGRELDFLATSEIVWSQLLIDGELITDLNSLYVLLEDELDKLRENGKKSLLNIRVENIPQESDFSQEEVQELLISLQASEELESVYIFPLTINLVHKTFIDREQFKTEATFFQQLFKIADEELDFSETIQPLYGHNRARRFLEEVTEEEEAEIAAEAEQLLLQLLTD